MINADLGRTLEEYVSQLVASGRYDTQSDVLRDSVRLLQDRDARIAQLDAALDEGIADAEAGRVYPLSDVFDELEGKLTAAAALTHS